MIDPKKITPLLSNMSVDREIGRGPNGVVYQITRRLDGKKLALKHISIPAKDSQTQALIYAGAVANEAEAQRYYNALVKEIKDQLLQLNGIRNANNLLKYRGYQVDQKIMGPGFDVYLLADFHRSLPEILSGKPISELEAVNLAIDLCSALEQLRSEGLIHSDVRPTNIFMGDSQRFLLGDLGLVKRSELPYSSMPDQTITEYTAPEVTPADAPLSDTMDIYAVGMILYEIYNGLQLPGTEDGSVFTRLPGELPAPAYADEGMADMILRACAYDPAERYQDPAEMKQALVLYMQRSKLSQKPLLPQPEPEAPEIEEPPAASEAVPVSSDEDIAQRELEELDEVEALEEQEDVREYKPQSSAVEDELNIIEAALANPEPEEYMDAQVLSPVKPAAPTAAPAADDEADAAPAAEAAEGQADEGVEETAASEADSAATKVIPVAEVAAAAEPRPSLNDLGEEELLMPSAGEISVEEFLASIRTTPGLEVLSMDADGNTVTMPGYETEETLPDSTEFLDSADSRSVYDPAVDLDYPGDVPEDIEVPVIPDYYDRTPEPQTQDYSTGEEALPEEEPEVPTGNEKPTRKDKKAQKRAEKAARKAEKQNKKNKNQKAKSRYDDYDADYDDGYDDEFDDDYGEDTSKTWKRALIAVIVLLVLAGGAFAGYTFKTDTINTLETKVNSASSISVTADSRNSSSMEVVCATANGEVARLPMTQEGATFTDLEPSTAYSFTLHSTEGKLLLGSRVAQGKTKQMTNLTGFQAASLSATTADLVIRGSGDQPEWWVVTCTGENGDVISASSTDASQPIHVEGLTPETKYTAVISRSDGDTLGGVTTCEFTTQYYTVLSEFELSNVSTESATVKWLYSGTVPETWTVTCDGTDGSSTSQEVSGSECTLDGLSAGVTYTISLNCPSLKETDVNTITVGIPNVNITEIAAVENDDGNIEVTWEYEGDSKPSTWSISYVYTSNNPATPALVESKTNSVTLTGLLPNSEYTIVVESADDFQVGGGSSITCVTSDADPFTKFGCTDTSMTLYPVGGEDGDPVTSFTPDQHIAFAVQASYEATEEDKNVKTLYLIRDSEGKPLFVYRNDDPGRSWSGNWTTARHTGDLPDMPQTPGAYTLEVYFDGCYMASADFVVEAPGNSSSQEEADETSLGEEAEGEDETGEEAAAEETADDETETEEPEEE